MVNWCASIYRFSKSALGVANFLAAIAIVLGALYGWMEYRDSVKKEMIEMSYSISHEYRSEHMTIRRNIVTTELNYDYNQELAEAMELEGEVPEHKMCLGFVPIEHEDDDDKTRENFLAQQAKCNALHSVLEFFDDALQCIKFGGCDKKTLIKLLQADAESMLNIVKPFISAGEDFGFPRYALGIQCIAGALSEMKCR